MERPMTGSRLSARRPTESSKALSATKDKALSAVSLTKRTNSLVSDVEEVKNNVKGLQELGRAVVQQEQTVQEMSDKVDALQGAFNSLSDVCIYIEDTQKKMEGGFQALVQRVDRMEKNVTSLLSQASKTESKRKQFQDATEQRFSDVQEAFLRLTLSVYEAQAELGRVKNAADHLMTREQEATHLAQSLQAAQEQTAEVLQRLRHESAQLQTDLYTLKEQNAGATVTLASDVQVLAKECSSVRTTMTQQHGQWLSKLDTLREAIDRQNKIEKSQFMQRLDALGETVIAHELKTKDALATLLKNHARIREAVDESMSICSSEIRILSQEWKTVQEDHRVKLEDIVQQLAQQGIDASQKYEALKCSVRSMAIQLDVEI